MLKKLLFIILFYQFLPFIKAQQTYDVYYDSVQRILSKTKDDTAKVLSMVDLSFNYSVYQVDTSILYSQKAIKLARQLNYKNGEAFGLNCYAWALWMSGNYDKAVEMAFKSLNVYKGLQDRKGIASAYNQLAVIYSDMGDYTQALKYGLLSKKVFDSDEIVPFQSFILAGIYLSIKNIDSASFYMKEITDLLKQHKGESGVVQDYLGDIEVKKKNYNGALTYYWSGVPIALNEENYLDLIYLYNSIAKLYYETGNIDSSIYYGKELLNIYRLTSLKKGAFDAFTILAKDYKLKNQNDSSH
jgi:tetratricopeptide (TPR) repeat protein